MKKNFLNRVIAQMSAEKQNASWRGTLTSWIKC